MNARQFPAAVGFTVRAAGKDASPRKMKAETKNVSASMSSASSGPSVAVASPPTATANAKTTLQSTPRMVLANGSSIRSTSLGMAAIVAASTKAPKAMRPTRRSCNAAIEPRARLASIAIAKHPRNRLIQIRIIRRSIRSARAPAKGAATTRGIVWATKTSATPMRAVSLPKTTTLTAT